MAITAILVSKDNKTISQDVVALTKGLSEEHTKILAEAHKTELDKAIDDTRTRAIKPQGDHLKDQIQVEKISQAENSGYGVGNLETLNQKAPWWRWINYGIAGTGRTVPPSTKDYPQLVGHFVPTDKGIFTKGQPKFPIFTEKAIQAHNYIEKALGSMLGKVRELLK